MAEQVLVVDFGSWGTSAALVANGRTILLGEPMTGSLRWPSAAFLDSERLVVGAAAQRRRDGTPTRYVDGIRTAVDSLEPVWLGERRFSGAEMLTAYLEVIVGEGERVSGARADRLALTVPSSYRPGDPRRELMVSAATAAGFPDVELISDCAAAVLDPQLGASFPAGSLALVCDLGATWTIALVRVNADSATQLAEDSSRGGRDFDLMLMSDLRAALHDWIEPILAAGGEDAPRLYYAAADLVTRLKHDLDDAEEVTERLAPTAPPYRLNRAGLERFAEPGLRWLLGSARALVARAGESLTDVASVVLLGGGSRLAVARSMVHAGLGRPVLQTPDPELAVIRGAARWAARVSQRSLPAQRAKWRVEPLCWDVPEAGARLLRWLVAENEAYPAGAALAQVRTSDDRVYDLTAPRKGVLLEQRAHVGAVVVSGAVTATSRSDSAMAGGTPVKRYTLGVAGEWFLTSDRQALVECADDGGYVKVRAVGNGAVVSEVRPTYDTPPRWGRVYRAPSGQFVQVSCDGEGRFAVIDVSTGRQLATFAEAGPPTSALVDESRFLLATETGRKAQVGRYRRDVASVWDLASGNRLDDLIGEDLRRLYVGYADRSTANGFAEDVYSADRRLRAVATRNAGPAVVSLQEVETGQEVFRVDQESAEWARVGFDAEGRHLIAYWRSGDSAWVDVWEV